MDQPPSFRDEFYFPFPRESSRGVSWYSDVITLPMLQEAYWHGIFPWPDDDENAAIPWVFPGHRGLIPPGDFHIPHTVLRLMKKNLYEVRIDTAFEQVIRNCAERNDGEPTWITSAVIGAYQEFHRAGWAHSFEVWNRETGALAGGLYGVSIGGVFAGESMFYRESGASKIALAALERTLEQCGVKLLDTQMVTSVTSLFGAEYYPAAEYLTYLNEFRGEPLSTEQLRAGLSSKMS